MRKVAWCLLLLKVKIIDNLHSSEAVSLCAENPYSEASGKGSHLLYNIALNIPHKVSLENKIQENLDLHFTYRAENNLYLRQSKCKIYIECVCTFLERFGSHFLNV